MCLFSSSESNGVKLRQLSCINRIESHELVFVAFILKRQFRVGLSGEFLFLNSGASNYA